ncbi:MAG: polysaccharide pyruvyl transferase family protein [Pseudomonadota bacterium]
MTAPLSVLHIASFSGNIGDNANHMGFRPWFEAEVGAQVAWTNLEIREFYWHERQWDEKLVEFINTHDVLIIGGGNYFELWVEHSPTGTSIALEPDLFDQIKVPVFFNALGVDPGQGVPHTCRQRFAAFLDKLLDARHVLVSVRNDGARENLRRHIGSNYADKVHSLPDHGFFVPPPPKSTEAGDRQVAINLACDMSDTRFADFESQAEFAREMASVLTVLADAEPKLQFCLVPHIFRDLEIISDVIGFLDDRLRRTRLTVASYGSGDEVARQTCSLYRSADLVLGMRFHANVCPMALGTPVLGLSCYPQIENLYRGLGLADRLVPVGQPGFAPSAIQLIRAALADPSGFRRETEQALEAVREERTKFEPHLRRWLAANITT